LSHFGTGGAANHARKLLPRAAAAGGAPVLQAPGGSHAQVLAAPQTLPVAPLRPGVWLALPAGSRRLRPPA
jgi:hypothetical protein